jgi:hypothetical protein
MLFNAALIGLLMAYIDARLNCVSEGFSGTIQRFDGMNQGYDGLDKRFDEMRDLWRAELRRVEECPGASLKHLEER